MYRIVERDRKWVVCVGPVMLLAFDSEDAAVGTINDAENLMNAVDAAAPSPPDFAAIAETARPDPDAGSRLQSAPAFVERRRTSRANQPVEAEAAE